MIQKTLMLTMCLIMTGTVSLKAQSDYLTATEVSRKAENVDLGGKASFVFESKSKDLVITSSINSDAQKPAPKSVAGGYQYEFVVPADGKRTFTVTKQGTAYSASVMKMPYANRRVYYAVEEIANPITLENQSSRTDHYFVEKKACIQFTSPIKDLKIDFSKKIGGETEQGIAASGAYLIKLIIDMDSLNKYRNNIETVQNKYDAISKTIKAKELQDPKSITDEEWDQQEQLKKDLMTAQSDWIEVATIKVYGEGTNVITLPANDIMAIQTKSLTPYGILLLKEKEKVFVSKYAELIQQANDYMKNREYELASAHYISASEADGVSETDKLTARKSAERMDKLDKYKDYLDAKADELFLTLKNGGKIKKKQLFSQIDEVIALNKAMYKETNDIVYLEEANRLEGEKQKVGLVLKGRFVLSEYKGGKLNETPMTNVKIYGSQAFNCDDMDKPSYGNKGELITYVTDPEGKYSFNFPQGKYRTIIFEAVNNPEVKVNKHISVVGRNDDRNVKIRFPKK